MPRGVPFCEPSAYGARGMLSSMQNPQTSSVAQATDWERFRKFTGLPTYRLLQWDKHRAFRRLLDDVIGHVRSPLSFIELGCGSGRIAAYLASILPIRRMVLLDRSPSMLALTRATMERAAATGRLLQVPGIDYVEADFFSSLPSEEFDVVLSQGVVEHFEPTERRRLLEIHRALCRTDGTVLIAVPTPVSSYRLIRRVREVTGTWMYPDEHPLELAQLRDELAAAGLVVDRSTMFLNFYLTELLVRCRRA